MEKNNTFLIVEWGHFIFKEKYFFRASGVKKILDEEVSDDYTESHINKNQFQQSFEKDAIWKYVIIIW